jgi:hypothetical protein
MSAGRVGAGSPKIRSPFSADHPRLPRVLQSERADLPPKSSEWARTQPGAALLTAKVPLSQPTAVARPGAREQVFMALTSHSRWNSATAQVVEKRSSLCWRQVTGDADSGQD